ncbi:gliding motility protein GldN [Dysgonomonas sp. 216]|uniref:type IX secretion system ring protein PorN/GldN n=1 Tax=Dysgonomonas sp. 216 TaxID=2302934 RepID=UPI0013D25E25|nr:gliding motility protein GldN [Dysgonomonas sp. 216]NDW18329.1 gliding motility protein GldN [Dysgonomonas sp. 216]NDW18697.1 gliding motility protein GldN [Dysgonomonas sp. 216]
MKRLFLSITIILAGVLFVGELSAQESSVRDRIARRQQVEKNKQSIPQLTVRANNRNQSQTQEIANAPWVREIYRFLDLNKEKNASLYYPVTPIGDRMNLFTMMFRLLSNNEITAYEFPIDRVETFSDADKLNFKDLLDRFGIMYTEENGVYSIEDADVPSNEVTGYYVKEAWYFDKSNSVVDIKILAICPVIFSQGDFEAETTRYPLFWLPYEEIRPYAARMPIMLSNLNNASNQTIDDFFRKRSFEGDIYKTTNMKNLTLAQTVNSGNGMDEIAPIVQDSLLKKEQAKIEGQLKQFKTNLWAVEEPAPKVKDSKKSDEKKEDESGEKSDSDEKVRTNEVKQEKSSSSSKSAPVRSMRGRRR